ncbi:MAG: alanine--tRNA ligase, partial [Candidatus Omnitrophota bacterium]
MTADILRTKFLSFFKSKKHKVVESDSLVPKDDPTVLFTPAGMNQFKKQFLGALTGFSRAATSQRCLRTGDLEKVGKTSGHHTFFEMLGNFSFGDYFKEDAINWAWEFLTKELKISESKLWVSVYRDDLEAFNIWKDKINVPVKRIVKLGDKENFWPAEAKQKGPNGPCGPCSEIFYDYGSETGCGKADCTPACDCGRFIEIWNLVFTQFNRKDNGVLEALPNKNIDTGMGLERLTAVIQGVKNNFETDLFRPLIDEIKISAVTKNDTEQKKSIYAIADHVRAIVFSIYDGVMPSNEGRGYVIRKIIRKSILHLRSLGIAKPFLNRLVPVLAEAMKNPYPELAKRREDIAQVILSEENNFISMLNSSDAILNEKFSVLEDSADPREAGRIAFQLYDTYGLPFEITKDWTDKHRIKISEGAFEKEMQEQKERSKNTSTMKGDVFDVKGLHLGIKATKFLGYEKAETPAKILAILKGGTELKKASANDTVNIILDKTTLYGESGGQVADKGQIIKGKSIAEVIDSKKYDKNIVHTVTIKKGAFKKGDLIKARVDMLYRLAIERNHTATHVLQAALRQILGAHVKQQGSLVSAERLRFDFTHFKAVSAEELERVEELVNSQILSNAQLCIKV